MRKLPVAAALAVLPLLASCGTAQKAPAPGATRIANEAPYDVRPLLRPAKKYLGVAYDGAGNAKNKGSRTFGKIAGKQPNIVPIYQEFSDLFPEEKIKTLWNAGALPLLVWEPQKVSLQDIAAGKRDLATAEFAAAVRALNIPVVISFAHEMNGSWYPWGTKKAKPADFIAAYRHVHDIFDEAGATNAIWLWSPNVLINNSMKLKPYWPGAQYVDWLGPIGYIEWSNDSRTFDELFGPPIKAMRKFTDLPVLIPETAAPDNPNKAAHVTDVYTSIAKNKDIIGVVWFNMDKERDWRIQVDPAAVRALREAVSKPAWGFDPRKLG